MNQNLSTEDQLAIEIQEMIGQYYRGELKRGGQDFVSGLIKAYSIIVGEPDVDTAFKQAMQVKARGHEQRPESRSPQALGAPTQAPPPTTRPSSPPGP